MSVILLSSNQIAEIKANSIAVGYSGLTAADIAQYTGKAYSASEQELIETLIRAVEAGFVKACSRNFAGESLAVYYEVLNAGESLYNLYNFPVKEIRKISLDGSFIYDINDAASKYKLNTDFFLYDEHLEFSTIPYGANNNRQALKVYYTIDDFLSDDLLLAIKQYVADEFSKRQYGGKSVRSYSFAGLSVQLSAVPQYIKDVIDTYRKIII